MARWHWLALSVAIWAGKGQAEPRVQFLDSTTSFPEAFKAVTEATVSRAFDTGSYRQIRAQLIYGPTGEADHVLVQLLSKTFHRVEFAALVLKPHGEEASVRRGYLLQDSDKEQQPGLTGAAPHCPDETVEFIAFAPNDDQLELDITRDVARAAREKNLKTVELLTGDATREQYLNYMLCSKLRGNFYDGDADPQAITTVDGLVTNRDVSRYLRGSFRHKVTNIWLACEAYNNPILDEVQGTAQSKKYAAGVNDLEVGPSDRAAACAMKAAMDGQPMTAAFQGCYTQYDDPSDQWGFGGEGSDLFGIELG